MTVSRDYYEVLGVPRAADAKTIKDAFRQLARRYHPDISTEPDAEQRFKEITEAYGVLSDPARRASYDAQGAAGLAGTTAEDLWGGIDFAGIFGSGAPAFGSLFERLFGPGAAGPRRGEDVRLDLVLSLDEVLTGGNHAVTIRLPGPCPRCAGRGRVIDQLCPACAASGRAVRQETVTIGIPPGIPEGAMLRLAGHGMPSPVPGPTPGSPGPGPICGTTCTSRHPTPRSASPRPCPCCRGRRGSGCHRGPSPAACCASEARACRAMTDTAAAA